MKLFVDNNDDNRSTLFQLDRRCMCVYVCVRDIIVWNNPNKKRIKFAGVETHNPFVSIWMTSTHRHFPFHDLYLSQCCCCHWLRSTVLLTFDVKHPFSMLTSLIIHLIWALVLPFALGFHFFFLFISHSILTLLAFFRCNVHFSYLCYCFAIVFIQWGVCIVNPFWHSLWTH